jgi:hypothetical protein
MLNVTVAVALLFFCAFLLRKTSAAPGAGTVTGHTLCLVSQSTVYMSSDPWIRPSDSKGPPNVYSILGEIRRENRKKEERNT